MKNKLINSQKRMKKYLFSAFWFFIICMIYGMIFSFSAQDGDTSGGLSHEISVQCVELWDKVGGHGWTAALKAEIAEDMEHPIRKLAHFAEYALLAFAFFQLAKHWGVINRKILIGIFLVIFISAIGDEIHQYFVPGRWCSPVDVLIDSAGGVCGLLFAGLLSKIKKK